MIWKVHEKVFLIFLYFIHLFYLFIGRLSTRDSVALPKPESVSKPRSLSNVQSSIKPEVPSTNKAINELISVYKSANSVAAQKKGGMYDDDTDDDEPIETIQFTPPKYVTDEPSVITSAQSPSIPMSMQKVFK